MAGDGSARDPGHGADKRRRPLRDCYGGLRLGPAVHFGEGAGRAGAPDAVPDGRVRRTLALLLSLIEAPAARRPDRAARGARRRLPGARSAGWRRDRLGDVSSFVTIASQLILIESRAMLPRRTDPTDPIALADEGVDPEAELRARLLLYARTATPAPPGRGRPRADRSVPAEPSVTRGRGWPERDPSNAPTLDRAASSGPRRLAAIAPPTEPPPVARDRTVSITERAEIIRSALRDAPRVVLQDLLTGVRDRA